MNFVQSQGKYQSANLTPGYVPKGKNPEISFLKETGVYQ